jgi:hypothetical protein
MISPYKEKINSLRTLLMKHIEEVDYSTADECFDSLSSLYFLEFVFYSRVLDEEMEPIKGDLDFVNPLIRNETLIRGTLEELSFVMKDWREMIELQAKWGTIR